MPEGTGGDEASAAKIDADEASDPEQATPAVEQATHQDKTKDKPDSGQNEDG